MQNNAPVGLNWFEKQLEVFRQIMSTFTQDETNRSEKVSLRVSSYTYKYQGVVDSYRDVVQALFRGLWITSGIEQTFSCCTSHVSVP